MEVETRRNAKRARGEAAVVERALKRIDRGVARYGAEAVAKYYTPKVYTNRVSAIPPETKYFDTSFSATVASAADWTGTEVPCTNYIQSDGTTVGAYTDSSLLPSAVGAGYGQVIGSKYFLKAHRVRGVLSQTTALADQADVPVPITVTLALVHDTQPNGAQAQGEEVFTDMGTAGQVNHSFQAMGAGAGGRFKILKRKVYVLQPAVAGTDGANTNSATLCAAQFSFEYQPKKPLLCCIKSSSSTPTVATISDNNIFLLAHSSGVGNIAVTGCSRAYYAD